MNFQESTTILNAYTKKSGNLLKAPRILMQFCVIPRTLLFFRIEAFQAEDIGWLQEMITLKTNSVCKETLKPVV